MDVRPFVDVVNLTANYHPASGLVSDADNEGRKPAATNKGPPCEVDIYGVDCC